MARSETPSKNPRFVMMAAVCVIVAALYFARDVLIPVALAVMLSFLLGPLVMRLERKGLHRGVAVTILTTLLFAVVGFLGWIVIMQLDQLGEQLPQYQDNMIAKIRDFRGHSGGGSLGKAADAIQRISEVASEPTSQPATTASAEPVAIVLDEKKISVSPTTQPIPVRIVPPPTSPMEVLRSYIGDLLGPLGTTGIVVVFVIFMLIQREDLRDRIIRLVGEGQIQLTTEALDDASTRISRYLLAQGIVNGTYGLSISIGLCIIGFTLGDGWFPSFVLWGFLCAVLRFIPYLGPWLAAAFPMAIAFAVFPGYSVFAAVAGMFIVIELLSNNLMEPWLYGSSTGISSLAVLVAAVFWTWLWGTAGLLLSTPLTVCMAVLGKHVPQLKFLDILLGDQPVLEPHERLYQRLLAMDNSEATEVADAYFQEHPLEELYDKMMLPALSMVEQDRHTGRLDESRGMFVRQSIQEMVEEFADDERIRQTRRAADETLNAARDQEPAKGSEAATISLSPGHVLPKDCQINVICLPAHDHADEIVGMMLTLSLERRGYCVQNISQNALASEMLDEVERKKAQIVCISALPPGAITHARYLCKRLSARFQNISLVVGLWTLKLDMKKARQRIACDQQVPLTTTLLDALEQIRKIAEPLAIQRKDVPITSSSLPHRP